MPELKVSIFLIHLWIRWNKRSARVRSTCWSDRDKVFQKTGKGQPKTRLEPLKLRSKQNAVVFELIIFFAFMRPVKYDANLQFWKELLFNTPQLNTEGPLIVVVMSSWQHVFFPGKGQYHCLVAVYCVGFDILKCHRPVPSHTKLLRGWGLYMVIWCNRFCYNIIVDVRKSFVLYRLHYSMKHPFQMLVAS